MKEGKLAVLKDMVKVGQWPNCTSVDVTGTPIEDAVDNIKMELLIILDQFTKINEVDVTDEDRKEAATEKEDRRK